MIVNKKGRKCTRIERLREVTIEFSHVIPYGSFSESACLGRCLKQARAVDDVLREAASCRKEVWKDSGETTGGTLLRLKSQYSIGFLPLSLPRLLR